MTIGELRSTVEAAKAAEHEYVRLTVRRSRQPRTNEGRLWRGGPPCKFIFEIDRGRWLVDVKTDALARALPPADPSETGGGR